MRRSRRTRFVLGAPLLAVAAIAAVVALLLFQLPADALDVTGTPSPVTGNATYFSGLGSPYGGCGLPQANLDSQDFVALNVFNTPGDSGPSRGRCRRRCPTSSGLLYCPIAHAAPAGCPNRTKLRWKRRW